jgi:hypothetical protein
MARPNAAPIRMGAKKKQAVAAPKELRGLSIRRAANGYIVDHDYEQDSTGGYIPGDSHVMPDEDALHGHIKKLFPSNRQGHNEQA